MIYATGHIIKYNRKSRTVVIVLNKQKTAQKIEIK